MTIKNSYLIFNFLLFTIIIMSLLFTIFLFNSKAAKKDEKNRHISKILRILIEMPVFYIFIKWANLTDSKYSFTIVISTFVLNFTSRGLYKLYKLYKIDKDLSILFGLVIIYFLIIFSIIFIDYKKMFDLFLIQ